ncbi:hypothetical protein PLESTF_000974500 [Pleodorina starrii]|nr:hypothetical protein PLESTF_000974500 [Pleodorina starrii]
MPTQARPEPGRARRPSTLHTITDSLTAFLEQPHFDENQVPAALRRELIALMSSAVTVLSTGGHNKMYRDLFLELYGAAAAKLATPAGDGHWKHEGELQKNAVDKEVADLRAHSEQLCHTNTSVLQPLLQAAEDLAKQLRTLVDETRIAADERLQAAAVLTQREDYQAHQRVEQRHGALVAFLDFSMVMQQFLGGDFSEQAMAGARAVERRLQSLPPSVADPGPVPQVPDARRLAPDQITQKCSGLLEGLYKSALAAGVQLDLTPPPSPSGPGSLLAAAAAAAFRASFSLASVATEGQGAAQGSAAVVPLGSHAPADVRPMSRSVLAAPGCRGMGPAPDGSDGGGAAAIDGGGAALALGGSGCGDSAVAPDSSGLTPQTTETWAAVRAAIQFTPASITGAAGRSHNLSPLPSLLLTPFLKQLEPAKALQGCGTMIGTYVPETEPDALPTPDVDGGGLGSA